MQENKILNIKKNFIKKKKFLKNEFKKIILKSIIQNKNIKPLIRSLSFYKLSKLKYMNNISKHNNNICLYSGRIKGAFSYYKMSRHLIKKNSYVNELQNTNVIN
jgi:hypothetical protein